MFSHFLTRIHAQWDADADIAIIGVKSMNKAVWGNAGDIGKGKFSITLKRYNRTHVKFVTNL